MSRLTREASSESTRQTVVSSFLQEKLQQSRQAESDRSSTWSRANTDVNSSGEFSRSLNSPIKIMETDGHRPQSAAGNEAPKKKGLGVKDMEQVISSLHKQNFDLKLELYHRRERQTALEDKVETIEMEKSRLEETNDYLSQEMEKRDKAIEEAVAMIVNLEARLEQLSTQRSIIEQIEAEGQYAAPTFGPCYEDPRPATQSPDMMRQMGGGKAITRMPSFLSDRSETTENLRNVYLGVRGSVLSLAQVPEGPGDADNGRGTGPGSPSLSVLSESSFVSVYGSKGDENSDIQEADEPIAFNGAASLPAKASTINRPNTAFSRSPVSASRSARSNSLSTRQAQFDSINNVIEYSSPSQKTSRNHPPKTMDGRQSQDQDGSEVFAGRAVVVPNHRRTKEEKRDSLRRVMTDAPGGVRLHDQNLPPTPDTISTSTLSRYKNSDETLSKHSTMRQSHGALSEASENDVSAEMFTGVRLEPMRAIRGSAQIIELNNRAYAENRGRSIQRPRSADETTISNRRGNDWDSDTDDSDGESLESDLDIWMRESAKPNNNGGRASPDLFSFPSNTAKGSWAMEAMYGPGSGHSGGASTGVDPEMVRDLFPVQQELFSSSLPPPPPNRRSSLNAHAAAQPKALLLSQPPANPKASKAGPKKGHKRRNSDDIQIRAGLHTQNQAPSTGDLKKKHYPPITGQQPSQNKFTKFFRRSSIGPGSSSIAPPPASTPDMGPSELSKTDPSNVSGVTGLPSWMSRTGVVDEDRDSATPPPIMRNPRHGRHASADVDMFNNSMMSPGPGTPTTPRLPGPVNDRDTPEQSDSPRATGATGARRKWLPAFGLRNKQG
ncbi:uncharacterized protein FTOL_01715 [Fusarium torulosum]|uniref:Centrosomin N-terminal motif 1 domain-containing protein n=1 Tax=Fusarium torulosum TaxID=33205 RepID=A0AAE8SDX2_9HYPO|nr:uncharacterized protein FTOL_01715 [Fusarium torulosum]